MCCAPHPVSDRAIPFHAKMTDVSSQTGSGQLPLRPKKSFGQNFLINRPAIGVIVRAALDSNAIRLLEVGPGTGALTDHLISDGRELFAVEMDSEAIEFLRSRFSGREHFHLIFGDAATTPLLEGPPWSIVGNLPYNAATAILTRFLLDPVPWDRMVLMFQLEVGQKLLGRPSEKAYGPLSVLAQLSCRMTRLMKLGPGSFHPPPKVDSVVLQFEPRPDAIPSHRRRTLLDLLHRSFAHRRKTLVNNWVGWLDPAASRAILEAEGLDSAIRAEAISPAKWVALLNRVEAPRPEGPGLP